MKRVLIIQAQMKRYRVPFFEELQRALQKQNLRLRVAYSPPTASEAQKASNADLSTHYGIKVKGHWLFGERVLYQPLLREILQSDLIIVEQANKHVLNHFLLVLSALGLKRVAFWGHGRNRQSSGASFSEWLKGTTLGSADWWFAYTNQTKDYLERQGVGPGKITVVENAVDTRQFRKELASILGEEREEARRLLTIAPDSQVALFCGAITQQKRPEFLIASAVRIKELAPRFELIVIGGGPQEQVIKEAASKHSWIHFLGPQFGRNKALYHRISDVALMPCAVGLGILDAFAAGLPLLTTDDPAHGPEIEYLENGINGLLAQQTIAQYSEAVAAALADLSTLSRLRAAALRSLESHSVEKMVDRFVEGVLCCLRMEPDKFAFAQSGAS